MFHFCHWSAVTWFFRWFWPIVPKSSDWIKIMTNNIWIFYIGEGVTRTAQHQNLSYGNSKGRRGLTSSSSGSWSLHIWRRRLVSGPLILPPYRRIRSRSHSKLFFWLNNSRFFALHGLKIYSHLWRFNIPIYTRIYKTVIVGVGPFLRSLLFIPKDSKWPGQDSPR